MSMLGTLAKVGIGVMAARGIGKMISNRSSGGGGGLGGMLGGMLGGGSSSSSSGGLGGMLGGAGGAAAGGGLGGMLGGMLGGGGGGSSSGGGLGGLLDQLKGGGAQRMDASTPPPSPQQGGFGSALNDAFSNFGEPNQAPTPDQEEMAKLMLRAMISAAKSDGHIDEGEKQRILGELGEVDQEEARFVQSELQKPLDIDGLVADVPDGMEQQVYLMSVMGIDLDSPQEARYLDQLAGKLGLEKEAVNAIHDQLGAPKLYS